MPKWIALEELCFDDREFFGEILTLLLKSEGISKTQAADYLGYSLKHFSRFCHGRSIPTFKSVVAFGILVGLNLEQIKSLLELAGYSFRPTITHQQYKRVITATTGSSGVARLNFCNEKLFEAGLKNEELLGRVSV